MVYDLPRNVNTKVVGVDLHCCTGGPVCLAAHTHRLNMLSRRAASRRASGTAAPTAPATQCHWSASGTSASTHHYTSTVDMTVLLGLECSGVVRPETRCICRKEKGDGGGGFARAGLYRDWGRQTVWAQSFLVLKTFPVRIDGPPLTLQLYINASAALEHAQVGLHTRFYRPCLGDNRFVSSSFPTPLDEEDRDGRRVVVLLIIQRDQRLLAQAPIYVPRSRTMRQMWPRYVIRYIF